MALITCKECNAQISEFAELCPNCGAPTAISKAQATQEEQKPATPYQQASTANTTTNTQAGQVPNEMPPKSWLVESILVTILCCLPFGIAGIVNASRVESRWYAGDKVGARRASEEAGRWTKIGFFGGLIVIVLYVILIVAGVVGGARSGSFYYY